MSREELNHAQSQVAAAQASLAAAQANVSVAREQLSSNRTLTEGTRVQTHPSVQAAAAKDEPRALSLLASLYQHGQAFPHDAAKAVEAPATGGDVPAAE